MNALTVSPLAAYGLRSGFNRAYGFPQYKT
jgi:hypothetical protein